MAKQKKESGKRSKEKNKQTRSNTKEIPVSPPVTPPHLAKYKKRILNTIIAILLILTVIIVSWVLLKAKLLVDEDIIVKTNISYSTINLKHGESTNLTLKSKVTTTPLCESRCEVTLTNIGNDKVVYSDTQIVKNTYEITSDFELTADKLGYGQELYSYEISCRNLYSNICPAPNSTVQKNALISMNYEPNELELKTRGELEKTLTKIIENLIQISSLTSQNKEYILSFNIKDKSNIQEKNNQIEKAYKTYEQFINDLDKEASNNYLTASQRIESANIEIRTQTLLSEAKQLNQDLKEKAKLQNEIIYSLNNITKEKELLEEMSQTENINKLSNKTTNLNHYNFIQNQTNKIILQINNNSLTNYSETIEQLKIITNTIEQLKLDHTVNFQTNYIKTQTDLNLINTSICITLNETQDCRNLTSLFKAYEQIKNMTLQDSIVLNKEQCSTIDTIYQKNNQAKQTQAQIRETATEEEIENADKEKLLTDYSIIQFTTQEIKLKNHVVPEDLAEFKQKIVEELNQTYNLTPFVSTNYYPDSYNETATQQASPLIETTENKLNQLQELCESSQKISVDFLNNHGEQINIKDQMTPSQTANYKIKNIKPQCCAYNFCYTCIENPNEKNNPPLLLLHGHSFYTEHTPDYSTNIFNELQNELEEDQYYIPGGLISSDKTPYSLTKSEFGKNPVPLMAKGTYYYIALYDGSNYIPEISKSENIDTYSIRLKDVIDELKYITGQEKIDIVAHSMGGLVLRRYIQLFGDEDINKAILIGSPNKGITDRIYNYCKLLGYENECDDMWYNSTLIKTLNDPNQQTNNEKIYSIIGVGCQMNNGAQGDGIVTKESATLNNSKTYIINGTCPLADFPLHNEMLDPDKYPEVYDTIKEILEEN